VSRIDQDPEQQRMVGAILTMAERLGLDILAEEVETEGERRMLTAMGCGHIQGYGIARSMPFAEASARIRATARQGSAPPPPRRRAV
jgi:EAL domain-containing protein (putative c-di-GMP-specific phosphodiesterase class I)